MKNNADILMKFISTQGYKQNSPDRNRPFNIIPSNDITMKNVPHNVMGVDDFGNRQLMFPDNNYQFPGNYVVEQPSARCGGKMQQGGANTNDVDMPYYNVYQDGGLSEEQYAQQADGQQGMKQFMMEIAQELQQGVKPEQLMQELTQAGVPQDQAKQMIQYVLQQMQGGQAQQQARCGGLKRRQQGGEEQSEYEQYAAQQGQGQPQGQPQGGEEGQEVQQLLQEVQQLTQQGEKPEQIVQELLQAVAQGQVDPNTVMQVLVQMGVPQEQAQQMIQQAMQQAQGQQGQPQGQMADGGIHINPKNEGKFTAKANRADMGVQEFAHHVMANKEDYPTSTIKQANFAINAKSWSR